MNEVLTMLQPAAIWRHFPDTMQHLPRPSYHEAALKEHT